MVLYVQIGMSLLFTDTPWEKTGESRKTEFRSDTFSRAGDHCVDNRTGNWCEILVGTKKYPAWIGRCAGSGLHYQTRAGEWTRQV